MIRLFTVLFFMLTSSAYAADMTIDMLNKNADGERMVYSTEVAKVAIGDTITWLPASKGHNVHFISAPDGVELVKSKMNREFSFTFEKEGIYLYQCTPHKAMGMIGLVVVGNDKSNLDKIKKVKTYGKSKKLLKSLLKSIS